MNNFKLIIIIISFAAGSLFAAMSSDAIINSQKLLKFAEKYLPEADQNEKKEKTSETTAIEEKKDADDKTFSLSGLFKSEKEEDQQYPSILTDIDIKNSFSYGKSYFTKKSYKQSEYDEPESKNIKQGFFNDNRIKLYAEGMLNPRINILIDYNNEREESENSYAINYHALEEDEVIREINLGDVDFRLGGSKFATYDNVSQKSLGLNAHIRKNNFSLKGFLCLTKGIFTIDHFKGKNSRQSINLREYQYVRNKYFQIEPFKRYDNLSSPPVIVSQENYITFSSNPANPQNYKAYSVNISPGSLEIYLDDQIASNNQNAGILSIDGGYYDKLSEGKDYSVNYQTGCITFLTSIENTNRIYAVYRLSSSSSDPSVRTDVIPGKNFVFLKYGNMSDEYALGYDANGDGKINYDIYEIRSVYSLSGGSISTSDFSIQIYDKENQINTNSLTKLGSFNVDYNNGNIVFVLREPFKQILSSSARGIIYSAAVSDNTYNYSDYSFAAEFNSNSTICQLSRQNIVKGSVIVKIDGNIIPDTQYTVDNTIGSVEFSNSSFISEISDIEIEYQYQNDNSNDRSLSGGGRAEYNITKWLKTGLGGVYSKNPTLESAPEIGNESISSFVTEGDITFDFNKRYFGNILKALSAGNIQNNKLALRTYYEYAYSRLNPNIYGMAILDDFESASDSSGIDLSENLWILASPAASASQNTRGKLLYRYYRNAGSSDLRGESFTPFSAVYEVKPGPYNVESGTLPDPEDNKSLVLDFIFAPGEDFVSAAIPFSGMDISSAEYIEITYKCKDADGSVSLSIDAGRISEDSDGDGILDTEDKNGNGELDFSENSSASEDKGYLFNPSSSYSTRVGAGINLSSDTRGDGILTTEDFNSNGILDTANDYFTFPSAKAMTGSSNTVMTISSTDTSWKTEKFYLRNDLLTSREKEILKSPQALRIRLNKISAGKGKIFISSLKIVTGKWKVEDTDKAKIRTSYINKYNDSEYSSNSFEKYNPSLLKKFYDYGTDEISEEEENSLCLSYDSLASTSASVFRNFMKNNNLSIYGYLNFFINPRAFTSGDYLSVSLGLDETNYYFYNIPLSGLKSWQEIKLKLNSASVTGISGYPDFKRIKYVRFSINGSSSGEIWINNIYLSSPQKVTGTAYYFESELYSDEPLYTDDKGNAYFDDFSLKFINKKASSDFISAGRTDYGTAENYYEISSSSKITKALYSAVSYQCRNTNSDSFDEKLIETERGKTRTDKFSFSSIYYNQQKETPKFDMLYSYEKKNNSHDSFLNGNIVEKTYSYKSHSPRIIAEKNLNTQHGDFAFNAVIDTSFREEYKSAPSADGLYYDKKKKLSQYELGSFKTSYSNDTLFANWQNKAKNSSIVNYDRFSVADQALKSVVKGQFYFPFFSSPEDIKFEAREKNFTFDFGAKDLKGFSPVQSFSFTYTESGFSDYYPGQNGEYSQYSRSRDALSSFGNKISIPYDNKDLFLKNASISFDRTLAMEEKKAPFEGENFSGYFSQYHENYGLSRSFKSLGAIGTNFFKYPFWKFFTGSGNYSNGRKILKKTLNNKIENYDDYDNSIALRDAIDLTGSTEFSFYKGDYIFSIWQNTNRQSISALPQQTVNFRAETQIGLNLADMFGISFKEPERSIVKKETSFSLEPGYSYERNMIITQNILEQKNSPSLGISLTQNDSSYRIKIGVDLINRKTHDYIKDEGEDAKYFANIGETKLDSKERSWNFNAEYSTGLLLLYDYFSKYYPLHSYPILKLSYGFTLNRYDYRFETEPEGYDSHLFSAELLLDIHENIKGSINGKCALEKWRERETGAVNREIISYELSFSLIVIF